MNVLFILICAATGSSQQPDLSTGLQINPACRPQLRLTR